MSKRKKLFFGILRVWFVCLVMSLIAKLLGQFEEQRFLLLLSAIVLPFYYVYKIYWQKKDK